MSDIPKQTCWSCQHFRVEYEGDWSDVTPGEGFTLMCYKNHYDYHNRITQEEFAAAMERGFTCPDFERRRGLGDGHGGETQ